MNTLLAQAATERRGGNLDAAIAAAERALRIAPADPAVYCELATLRLERGDYALAEQLARKGLSYQPDAQMQQRLNAIIERARAREDRLTRAAMVCALGSGPTIRLIASHRRSRAIGAADTP